MLAARVDVAARPQRRPDLSVRRTDGRALLRRHAAESRAGCELASSRDRRGGSATSRFARRSAFVSRRARTSRCSPTPDFATGNADNLLGSGQFSARGLAIMSATFGTLSAHGNAGYVYRGGGHQNDAVLATAGFDDLIAPTRDARGGSRERAAGWTVEAAACPRPCIRRAVQAHGHPTSIPDIADDLVNGSFGFKFTTDNGFTVVTNALVPLNRGGLRANITYTTGLEFAF